MDEPKKRRIKAEIERLTSQADQAPPGPERDQLVDQIADLNVEYQAED